MCGRFNVSADPLAEIFLELVGQPYPGVENYNTAPTEDVWIIRVAGEPSASRTAGRGGLEPAEARWWLIPYWSKDPKSRYAMFNAKSETLGKSGAFKEPFRRRRCLVPVSGFYEWLKEGGRKIPHYIRPAADNGMLLAGLWDRWRDRQSEQVIESFTVITTAVSDKLKFIHDRQPVILSRDDVPLWLDHARPLADLEPLFASRIPEPLSVIPVSTYVGNARNKEPLCIEPIGDGVDVDAD